MKCGVIAASIVGLALVASSTPARAQEVISKDAAAELKASFIRDLDVMRGKFVGLAEAFPQDKYTWRPMEGVRSVSEVLMLAAFEGYSFIPTSFGGKPANIGSREEAAKLRTLSDKAQVMGMDLSASATALGVGGDLHEHLGQLIAYARTNHIVPPWSK
jgi:hypothetical protein